MYWPVSPEQRPALGCRSSLQWHLTGGHWLPFPAGSSWLEVGHGVCLLFSLLGLCLLRTVRVRCVPQRLWGHVYLSCCVCLLSHWPPLALTVFPHPLPVGAPALAEGFGADIQLRAQCFKTLSLYFAVLWVTEGGNLSDVVE